MPDRKVLSDQSDWLTTGEAARLLEVSPHTVIRYVKLGEIRCRVLPSKHRRVSREDVQRLAERAA